MKVLHLDSNHPLLLDSLQEAGYVNDCDFTSDYATILKKLPAYDGLVIRSRVPVDKAFIDAGSNLKFIARVGAGLENIDCDYADQKGVHLIAAPEGNSNAVGEHSLSLLLNVMNKITKAHNEIQQGIWDREGNRGLELDGKTVGLIGYGNMGKAFARKLRGFDVKVIFHDLKTGIADSNAMQVTLEELQQQADVLSLHVPITTSTHSMVDADFIAGFKKPFFLINTARGECVVTEALVTALNTEQLLGAGLDVLEFEKKSFTNFFSGDGLPVAMQQLLSFDNVVCSPHVAGWTVESHRKLAQVIVDKIFAFAKA